MKQLIVIFLVFSALSTYSQNQKSLNRVDTLEFRLDKLNTLTKDTVGIVIIKVNVNRAGKVISATPFLEKSTIKDTSIINYARKTALKTEFGENANAAPKQTGLITYRIRLKN